MFMLIENQPVNTYTCKCGRQISLNLLKASEDNPNRIFYLYNTCTLCKKTACLIP